MSFFYENVKLGWASTKDGKTLLLAVIPGQFAILLKEINSKEFEKADAQYELQTGEILTVLKIKQKDLGDFDAR